MMRSVTFVLLCMFPFQVFVCKKYLCLYNLCLPITHMAKSKKYLWKSDRLLDSLASHCSTTGSGLSIYHWQILITQRILLQSHVSASTIVFLGSLLAFVVMLIQSFFGRQPLIPIFLAWDLWFYLVFYSHTLVASTGQNWSRHCDRPFQPSEFMKISHPFLSRIGVWVNKERITELRWLVATFPICGHASICPRLLVASRWWGRPWSSSLFCLGIIVVSRISGVLSCQ